MIMDEVEAARETAWLMIDDNDDRDGYSRFVGRQRESPGLG